jgi:hypothetical protein
MINKLLIVICTQAKTDKEFEQKQISLSLKKQYESNSNVNFHIFKDNKKGLGLCYNEILKDPNNLDKIALFVHDDVVLEDIFLYEKLMFSPYSITGLAGTKSFNKKADKMAWHLASNGREDFVGEVAHVNQSKQAWTTVFGPTQSRALIVDGLFIACKVKDLVDNDLYFDEQFEWHHYDMSFCLRANEKKVKVGVLPIKVLHYGLGDSMLSSEWEESNKKFKEIYCK